MRRLRIIILVTMMISWSPWVQAMRFDLKSGSSKCITEDIKSSALTVGKYSIITDIQPPPDSHKITIRVTSPYGNNYHYSDHVDSGTFAFTAAESGDYMACYWAVDHKPPVTLSIEFDWKSGVAAKDWSKVAKKGQVEVMQVELQKLYDSVTSIHEEMFYLREREEEMQALNRSTNSKMATFSFLSLLVCLSVAALQLWHLKTFFERKKLL
ncbi:hypothetical protein DCAR_0206251 [Daucus carota subsp. sativus]|uniref:GOLD domain-containing protein n=1 Tax=Daucus carota subsp. sativus TaxID=79200 RepID=A0A166D4N9_DAUCS|nr:PREDICTED: transmembrane emp24 domain-containing protein p24delta9-like [Daucus carota subsp. sativus]WOG87031.1 hypothetical protein DCAR_0206251 [Daucus carota subsp. sativus]